MEAFRTLSMFDWLLDEHSMYDDALISFESFFASWELMQELELDSLKSDFVPETKKKKDQSIQFKQLILLFLNHPIKFKLEKFITVQAIRFLNKGTKLL